MNTTSNGLPIVSITGDTYKQTPMKDMYPQNADKRVMSGLGGTRIITLTAENVGTTHF